MKKTVIQGERDIKNPVSGDPWQVRRKVYENDRQGGYSAPLNLIQLEDLLYLVTNKCVLPKMLVIIDGNYLQQAFIKKGNYLDYDKIFSKLFPYLFDDKISFYMVVDNLNKNKFVHFMKDRPGFNLHLTAAFEHNGMQFRNSGVKITIDTLLAMINSEELSYVFLLSRDSNLIDLVNTLKSESLLVTIGFSKEVPIDKNFLRSANYQIDLDQMFKNIGAIRKKPKPKK